MPRDGLHQRLEWQSSWNHPAALRLHLRLTPTRSGRPAKKCSYPTTHVCRRCEQSGFARSGHASLSLSGTTGAHRRRNSMARVSPFLTALAGLVDSGERHGIALTGWLSRTAKSRSIRNICFRNGCGRPLGHLGRRSGWAYVWADLNGVKIVGVTPTLTHGVISCAMRLFASGSSVPHRERHLPFVRRVLFWRHFYHGRTRLARGLWFYPRERLFNPLGMGNMGAAYRRADEADTFSRRSALLYANAHDWGRASASFCDWAGIGTANSFAGGLCRLYALTFPSVRSGQGPAFGR